MRHVAPILFAAVARAYSPLSPTPWVATPDPRMYGYVGDSVAGAGDVNGDGFDDVIVGASGFVNEGTAYLFMGSSMALPSTPDWAVASSPAGDFGHSVAGAGDVDGDGFADVVVGEEAHAAGRGRAYLFVGGPSGLATDWAWAVTPEPQEEGRFGESVAGAGDVNGDGFADVVVGTGAHDHDGVAGSGRAYLFLGSASGLATTPAWAVTPEPQVDASFGGSAAGAGDVNGDGFADVIVGARHYDIGDATDTGRAYLFAGSASGLATIPAWKVTPQLQDAALFGASVSSAGDVNGDGFADVVVGAPGFNARGVAGSGKAYLFLGGASGLATRPAWAVTPVPQEQGGFGSAVAGAGDVDGDGFADVLVGAASYDEVGVRDSGKAHLFRGSASGLATVDSWYAAPEAQEGGGFGTSVAGAGDVNGDGLADVVVGAPNYDDGSEDSGRVYAFYGVCAADPDCNDRNPCTEDHCIDGTCRHVPSCPPDGGMTRSRSAGSGCALSRAPSEPGMSAPIALAIGLVVASGRFRAGGGRKTGSPA